MSKLSDKAIIIIGAGPAGYSTALELRKQFIDQEIIIIEKNKLGGACLHAGCIPSKQLHSIQDLKDYPKLIKKNKTILEKAISNELEAAQIRIINDEASIEDGKVVISTGAVYEYSHLVLATGSKPKTLAEFPNALTSDSFFSEENLAKGFADKYCFIGGGYIGVELASMLAHHGKEVRIVEMLDEILGFLDRDIQAKIVEELKRQNISIETGVKDLSSLEISDDEEVFVSIGREAILPNYKPAENIHVIGDASQEIALAHYAYAQAKELAFELAGKEFNIDKNKVPLVIFSHPEVASIGLTTRDAQARFGEEYIGTKIINWASNGKARVSGCDRGITKWIINKETDRILGCHIVGPGATDLISIAVPIINLNLSIPEMQQWIYPHPTLGEIFAF